MKSIINSFINLFKNNVKNTFNFTNAVGVLIHAIRLSGLVLAKAS